MPPVILGAIRAEPISGTSLVKVSISFVTNALAVVTEKASALAMLYEKANEDVFVTFAWKGEVRTYQDRSTLDKLIQQLTDRRQNDIEVWLKERQPATVEVYVYVESKGEIL